MNKAVYIHRVSCFPEDLWPGKSVIQPFCYRAELGGWIRPVPESEECILAQLGEERQYREADRTVLLALAALRSFQHSGEYDAMFLGSSRVSTGKWESVHADYLSGSKMRPRYSPATTFGNLSHTLAHALRGCGAHADVSQTCSSGLQALLLGISWLNSGMGRRVICGASEAPLTPFTAALLKATGILSVSGAGCYPDVNGVFLANGTVLGEAAGLVELGVEPGPVAISGWGAGLETGASATGITVDGKAFQISMKQACNGRIPDVVVLHAPGTPVGDAAERAAVQAVFGSQMPALFGTKGYTGHALGAAGITSLSWAFKMLMGESNPYWSGPTPDCVLVNAMGFGGNAISVFLERTK